MCTHFSQLQVKLGRYKPEFITCPPKMVFLTFGFFFKFETEGKEKRGRETGERQNLKQAPHGQQSLICGTQTHKL